MVSKPFNLIDQYLQMQQTYGAKYGPDTTVVLMCVGSFFELYQVKNDRENIGCAEKVAQLANIMLTKKNKSIPEVSRSNPMLAGFPAPCLQRYLSLLVNHGYTVVVVDQVTQPPNPKREVTGIYSPGTMPDETGPDCSNIVCLSLGQETVMHTARTVYTCGMSVVDVSTGHATVHEAVSTYADPEFAVEDAIRFVSAHSPKEILIHNQTALTEDKLSQLLGLTGAQTYYFRDLQSCSLSLDFQEQLLKRVYPDTGMLTAIEFLDLERKPLAILSFTLLLNYCHEHGKDITRRMQRPDTADPAGRLSLEHNAITQLNILPTAGMSHKFGSLFDIFAGFTSTPMGRRMLRSMLLQPLTCPDAINARLDMVESLTARIDSADGHKWRFEAIESGLRGLPDIERLVRRALLQRILPHELASLMGAFAKVKQVLQTVTEHPGLTSLLPGSSSLEGFSAASQHLETTFDLAALETNSNVNIFQPGVETEADRAQEEFKHLQDNMVQLRHHLNDLADAGPQGVKLEHTDKDGHYLSMTARRATALRKTLETPPQKQHLAGVDTHAIKWTPSGTSCRITCSELDTWSRQAAKAAETLKAVCQERFTAILTDCFEQSQTALADIVNFISMTDCLKAAARAAATYKYCRPTVCAGESSSVKAKDMRHPIVERILTRCEYVPFWVDLGGDVMDVMLLYGANACGKSTSMKAVGLSVVLAQCGMFVPAAAMHIVPFTRIMTRIEGRDNMFSGQSTFAVEMGELRGILQRADKNSLVLGDEVAHGTETTSAVAIVASALIWLEKAGAKGLFATHLHQLAGMDRVQRLQRVRSYHLEVHCGPKGDLIYDRILKEGAGDGSYGLAVAKALRLEPGFIDLAHEIRREILGDEGLISTTPSRYNSRLFMRPCEICGMTGKEVHHVKPQKDADQDGFINSMHKNSITNLVVLCDRCHERLHHPDPESGMKLELSQLKLTSDGPRREITETVIEDSKPAKPKRSKRIARPDCQKAS